MLRSEKAAEASKGINPNRISKLRSQSTESDPINNHGGAASSSGATMVDHLQHENAELRRDLGAQTSMLTSRNRERERLQQEIEDLKLFHRRVDVGRSVTGESIFDRSVSRQNQYQRSTSRTSGQTGATQMSDAERDQYEQREGVLRDQNAALRLDFQDVQRQFNEQAVLVSELEEAVQISENELDAAVEDLRTVQNQRNEAIQQLEASEIELEQVKQDLRMVQNQRNEAIQQLEASETELEQVKEEHERLRIEAVNAIEELEDSLDKTEQGRERVASDLKLREDDFIALQNELHKLNDSLVQLEDDRAAALKRIELLEQELEFANTEMDELEKNLKETALKNNRLEVQSESLHNEISFLREEQEGDKIKIGDLENNLDAAQQKIQDEKEKMQELEESLVEERRQREIVDNQSKQEVQVMIDNLNDENSRSKDEIRNVKQSLRQAGAEATKYRTRLDELENSLRRVLGDRRSSWLQEIQRMQDELESTVDQYNRLKSQLAEKDHLLRGRDQLIEESGLESRKLAELLDKERALRKRDLHQFEQSLRGQSTNARAMAQQESRALELENARSQDRRKMMQLEQQYREQLGDRNSLLFTLWTKLSSLCGNEWAEHHDSINGEVTSVDAISRSLPGFQRNIFDAIKMIESLIFSFKSDIRNVEKDLRRDYQTLEQNLDARVKRMDFLERSVKEAQAKIETQAQESAQLRSQQNMNRTTTRTTEEITRLKQEVKVLKTEIRFHKSSTESSSSSRHQQQHQASNSSNSTDHDRHKASNPPQNQLTPRATMANSLLRHHSSSAIETLLQQQQQQQQTTRTTTATTTTTQNRNPSSIVIATPPLQPSEQRWIHRLKELERRLKAEREGRLLDRKGARQRLEERDTQLEDLRSALEREKDRRSSFGEEEESVVGEEEEDGEGRGGRASRVSARRTGGGGSRRERDGSVD
jgi:chromosome segregation ATPase